MRYTSRSLATGARRPSRSKVLGPGVLEVVTDHDRETYRAVYTVRLASGVYVLHCFQKKSSHGIKTPRHEIALMKRRLADAIEQDREFAEAKN